MTIGQRLDNVIAMDNEVRNFDDENLIMTWLEVGCPDESTMEDYLWFAEDENEYNDLVKLYNRLYAKENR